MLRRELTRATRIVDSRAMPGPALLKRLIHTLSRRKLERARRQLSLASLALAARGAVAVVLGEPATPRRLPSGPRKRRPRGPKRLEQLSLDLGPERPRWTPSRLVLRSPHRERILEYLEFARRFFPELEGVNIRVGLALKRGVLGWGSLDPDQPGIWVRPRRLDHFTIAHELTHLLQARGLVPHGERACDLWALARSPLIADHPPGYLRLPLAVRRQRRLTPQQAMVLVKLARGAIAAREQGDRRYLKRFEAAAHAELACALKEVAS
jgi:hypothetical protein